MLGLEDVTTDLCVERKYSSNLTGAMLQYYFNFLPLQVQECWCDWTGSLREGSESSCNTEKEHGSLWVSSECSLYQPSSGRCKKSGYFSLLVSEIIPKCENYLDSGDSSLFSCIATFSVGLDFWGFSHLWVWFKRCSEFI